MDYVPHHYTSQFMPQDGNHGISWLPATPVPMAVLILLVQSEAEDVHSKNGVTARCSLLGLALDALADVSYHDGPTPLRMHIRAQLAHTCGLCSADDHLYDKRVEQAVFYYWQAGRDALDMWYDNKDKTMLTYAIRWLWKAIVTVQRTKLAQELNKSVHYYILSALEMAYIKLDFPAKSIDTVLDTWTCAAINSKSELLQHYNAKLLAFSEYISICCKPDSAVTTAATDNALKRLLCYYTTYNKSNPKEKLLLHFSPKLQALWQTFEVRLLGAHFRVCVQEDAGRVVHSNADCERLAASLEVKYAQYVQIISDWNDNCEERLAFVEWLKQRIVTPSPPPSSTAPSVDVVPTAP